MKVTASATPSLQMPVSDFWAIGALPNANFHFRSVVVLRVAWKRQTMAASARPAPDGAESALAFIPGMFFNF